MLWLAEAMTLARITNQDSFDTMTTQRTQDDAFGSERYILTFENRSFRDVASFAPYELVEILTNSDTYGGGAAYRNRGWINGTNARDFALAVYGVINTNPPPPTTGSPRDRTTQA